jgi:FAD/FMN-containing dehydrogenase
MMDAAAKADFARAVAPVPSSDEPALVKQKSRDFYWYSPILKQQLRNVSADLIVAPRTVDEVIAVARECVARRVPLTVRGAGTGNYGQAMPLEGGVVMDMTAMTAIRHLGGGIIRVEPGLKLIDLEAAILPTGWELRFHPSTRRTATIGGFIGGGSSGIGSINYGVLRDRGNVLALKVVTLEAEPRVLELRGDDVQKVVHAYGTNGIIVELELPLARAWPWVDVIAAFPDFMAAARFGQALGEADAVIKKLITPVDASVAAYFKPLAPVLPRDHAIVIAMVAEPSLATFRALVRDGGGSVCFERSQGAHTEIPPLYEFTWNHTTLHALKVDRSITYLQTLFSPPNHLEAVERMVRHFGDETPMHLEFVRLDGQVGCFGLQLVRFTSAERLDAIIRYHEDNGCPIFNPHTYGLEDGGMKVVDQAQLAFKQLADPFGLLNPGKMRGYIEPSKWARAAS